nr:hypothetical protein BaRGS_003448 [Batillaria attramentaria]
MSEDKKDAAVLKKIQQAIDQLSKGQEVLRYLVSDKTDIPVKAVLAMPNVKKAQIHAQLEFTQFLPVARFICGPPGTGKTVVLMLMACAWLLRGRHVHIASTWSGSLAASLLITFELLQLYQVYRTRVHLHQFNLKETEEMEPAVKTLLKAVDHEELFVICDEAFGQGTSTPTGHTSLTFRDVLILTTYYDIVDEETDDDGYVEQRASSMVEGLREVGVRVKVVERGDSEALSEVVAMEGPDAVVAADADTIRGLERKLVVWVQADKGGNSSGEEGFGRLDAMSRTTAQLILVA